MGLWGKIKSVGKKVQDTASAAGLATYAAQFDVKQLVKDPKKYASNLAAGIKKDFTRGATVAIAIKTGDVNTVANSIAGSLVDIGNASGATKISNKQKAQFAGLAGKAAGLAKDAGSAREVLESGNASEYLVDQGTKQTESALTGGALGSTLTRKQKKTKAGTKSAKTTTKGDAPTSGARARPDKEQWVAHASRKETLGGVYR